MRTILFYVNLCFFLLLGGSHTYATTPHTTSNYSFFQNLPEKQQIRITSPIKQSQITESTCIDLDEEYHNDDSNDGVTTKFLAENPNLVSGRYLSIATQSTSKNYTQRIKIFSPFCGYSNPIYIRHSVLRI